MRKRTSKSKLNSWANTWFFSFKISINKDIQFSGNDKISSWVIDEMTFVPKIQQSDSELLDSTWTYFSQTLEILKKKKTVTDWAFIFYADFGPFRGLSWNTRHSRHAICSYNRVNCHNLVHLLSFSKFSIFYHYQQWFTSNYYRTKTFSRVFV